MHDLAGHQAFDYIGDGAFSGTAGELRFDKGVVQADVDGDGVADMEIYVTGASTLAEDDFILFLEIASTRENNAPGDWLQSPGASLVTRIGRN